ncbi:hypothetical protein BBP40_002942 [Aspergillus hancockii]|nr:hypothetical protein BBP40_002942 [Aspergillus hancockii]
MGRAWVGRPPFSPEDIQKVSPQARKWAAEQILNVWRWGKDVSNPETLWGDEIEYSMVELDSSQCRATALLCQESVLQQWDKHKAIDDSRRALIKSFLGPSQYPLTIATFPRLGAKGQYTTPHYNPSQTDIHYRMLPPQMMSSVLRYQYTTQKILGRRRRPVGVHAPIYQDMNTATPFVDDQFQREQESTNNASVRTESGCIFLEGQGFGMTTCALQTTFQTANERDARWLHDQLVVLGPTLLALTAGTPILKGYLVNTDARWNYLTASADDRTLEEVAQFNKSYNPCCPTPLTRWSSNRVYLSHDRPPDIANACGQARVDEAARQQLLDGGMDESMASYFSNLLWNEPMWLNQDDLDFTSPDSDHIFHKFQHGFWKHVHLKMPEADTGAGWRIEFRPMEVQFKDSENAAFAVFMFLLSRAIVTYRLNFYIPIELVTDSMERAQQLDAVTKEHVWFRRRDWGPSELNYIPVVPMNGHTRPRSIDNTYGLMTIDEIINGEHSTSPSRFPGLVAIARSYLLERELLPNEEAKLVQYLNLVSCRARGTLPTPARWMRDFVASHEDYQQDSVVGERTCHDMLREIVKMNEAD